METALSLIISNGDFPKKPLKHLLFLALKSKEMVECQEEGYQLHISNHRPSLASAGSSPALHTGDGSLKIIAARKLAGGGKWGENRKKYIRVYIEPRWLTERKSILNKWQTLDFHSPARRFHGALLHLCTVVEMRQALVPWACLSHTEGHFGVPDLGVNDLIRSSGEGEGGGRKEKETPQSMLKSLDTANGASRCSQRTLRGFKGWVAVHVKAGGVFSHTAWKNISLQGKEETYRCLPNPCSWPRCLGVMDSKAIKYNSPISGVYIACTEITGIFGNGNSSATLRIKCHELNLTGLNKNTSLP